MEWIIYKHTNKINGKCYIGQTKQNATVRWANGLGYNPYNSPKNCVFWNAIKRYGWDNFIHEIIEKNIKSQSEANEREIHWIRYFNSYVGFVNSNGYNMTLGGDSHEHQGLKVVQIDKNLKEINTFCSISNASKLTKISKSQIGRVCRGEKLTAGGYFWCYSKNYSENWTPKSNTQCCPVYQIDPDTKSVIGVFDSIIDAANQTNTNYQGIIQCCKRKTAKSNNYCWCYQWDLTDDWQPAKSERQKKIFCVEEKKVYNNAKLAAKEHNCNYQHILHSCNKLKGFNTVGGYHWCYLRDKSNFVERIDADLSPVYCVNTGEYFKSIQEASKAKNASASSISFCCRNLHKTACGLTWCYAKDYTTSLKCNKTKERKIKCIELNQIFDSISKAARQLKIARGSLSNCLAKLNKTSGGYHWEYVD